MIKPGVNLGILGSGQLGRMFTQVATKWGYNVCCYSPQKNSPAGKVGAIEFVGEYTNQIQLEKFLNSIDALTFEFENIPLPALELIQKHVDSNVLVCRPSTNSIMYAQNRTKEKSFFREIELPTTKFFSLQSWDDYAKIQNEIDYPCVLKMNTFGYDGKGQTKFSSKEELEEELKILNPIDVIVESFVEFDKEISVIIAQFLDGNIIFYPPVENVHKNHILDTTIYPANIPQNISDLAIKYATKLIRSLNHVGVLCLEFFVEGDRLICNEFAPRPHNSGHFSLDGANISQFELQLRTLCDIPLNQELQLKPCVMKNLLGEDLLQKADNILNFIPDPNYRLHFYQKNTAKTGRKMGHINYIGGDISLKAFEDLL